ncbi:MAG: HlyD family efflux transporter periplasmic adaptor subunit [Candidatus Kapabacteria bacterium]|nr:HlyD family efflux transporter periplasmic adaptor subunit [Candidatus Kapabacteria bacterium]
MRLQRPRHLGLIALAVGIIGLIVFALLPSAVDVDVVTVRQEHLAGYVEAEGRVRYVDHYVMSLPATATLLRVQCEPGDSVRAGDVIASYLPPSLDARQRDELSARAQAAGSALREAAARLAALEPMVEQARRKQGRMRRLLEQGAVATEQHELAADALQQLDRELDAARARLAIVTHERNAALAAIRAPSGTVMTLRAPVDGVVLRRFEEQERLLPAGSPIVEIGQPDRTEIVVDVVSTDAVKITSGMPTLISGWGSESRLRAVVRRVEPAARTKVSALGIEEQRVDVILTLDTVVRVLGDNYKVDAQIMLWQLPSARTLPLAALVEQQGAWHVYVIENGRSVLRRVRMGRRTTLRAEILEGLSAGEQVVVHPPEALRDGSRVNVLRTD